MSESRTPRLKSFEEPEIVTYGRDDLIMETVFTGETYSGSGNPSDRRLKTDLRRVSPRSILDRLS